MRTSKFIFAAAVLLLIFQSCKRNESLKSLADNVNTPQKLGASSAPSAYGCFQFTNVSSGKVMEVRGDSTLLHPQSNPKNVQQYTNFNTGAGVSVNQKWYLIQQGTGAITSSTPFVIMNAESGMLLEAPNGTSGTQLWDDHSNGFPSQAWTIHQVTGQSYYYIQNANGLVLTDHGSSTAD